MIHGISRDISGPYLTFEQTLDGSFGACGVLWTYMSYHAVTSKNKFSDLFGLNNHLGQRSCVILSLSKSKETENTAESYQRYGLGFLKKYLKHFQSLVWSVSSALKSNSKNGFSHAQF